MHLPNKKSKCCLKSVLSLTKITKLSCEKSSKQNVATMLLDRSLKLKQSLKKVTCLNYHVLGKFNCDLEQCISIIRVVYRFGHMLWG